MQIPKRPTPTRTHFRSVLPDNPEVVIKPMFGNLGAFVNGNMFAALFGSTIGVKLSEADKEMLESTERTVPFGPAERPMGGYTGLPSSWRDDPAKAGGWAERALAYVATLPPKAPKPRKPKAR